MEIGRELMRRREPGFESVEAVVAMIQKQVSKRLVEMGAVVEAGAEPEARLRQAISEIEDKEVRRKWEGVMAELEEARQRLGQAAGDWEAVDAWMHEIERRFEAATGREGSRERGKTYAGRQLIYEDSRRDVEVEIGEGLMRELRKGMELLLRSARWLTAEAARRGEEELQVVYERLVKEEGKKEVSGPKFWHGVQEFVYGAGSGCMKGLDEEFAKKWDRVLEIKGEQRRVAYTEEELREKVAQEFGGAEGGWERGRYNSPDVMIRARGLEAIRRGDYQLVLGELHMAANTLRTYLFTCQHPNPIELFQAIERDTRTLNVAPILSGDFRGGRHTIALVFKKDVYLEMDMGAPAPAHGKVLTIGSLIIEKGADGLVVRDRERTIEFSAVQAFAEYLSKHVVDNFRVLSSRPHTPRVSIDKLVVCRESWQVELEEMSFAHEASEASRYAAARRWGQRRGMPRQVFYKAGDEVKPSYMDFDSPLYVEMLSRAVRRSERKAGGAMRVSEMLPRAEEAWLEDGVGRRYTCELRMVSVDEGRRSEEGGEEERKGR